MTASSPLRVLSRGNRTEVTCSDEGPAQQPTVTKRLLPFANVATERTALYQEALVQHGARGPGVVPIVDPPFSNIERLHAVGEVAHEIEQLKRPFIKGQSVRELLARPAAQRKWTLEHCLGWMAELARILHRVHHTLGHGDAPLYITHRDVTPGNILLEEETILGKRTGGVWLNDFGLAHVGAWGPLSPEETLQGTRRFIAPELASGGQPSSATDVYQLGLLLGLLVGAIHSEAAPPSAQSGPRFQWWVRDLLSPLRLQDACADRPQDRPSALELARALDAV